MRAAELEGYQAPAAMAFREGAEIVGEMIQEYLNEALSIRSAASEFGWNYEALRRRVSGDPEVNSGKSGQPMVTRDSMGRLGCGRGPRQGRGENGSPEGSHQSDSHAASSEESKNPMPTRLQQSLDNAVRQRQLRGRGRQNA